ncbi:MAG: hypothetical protein ACI92G_004037 [Candidatus Pelagisphaera sp.]|jgi:hypothetical protein
MLGKDSIMLSNFFGIRFVPIIIVTLMLPQSQAEAVPFLQLDIVGGSYDRVTESIFSTASDATIVALATPGKKDTDADVLSSTTFLSIAAVKENGDAVSLDDLAGTLIEIEGLAITAENFWVGTPPFESEGKTLGSHGIYDTAFTEVDFQFAAGNTTSTYNSEYAAGASSLYDGGSGSFFKIFDVSISQLAAGINLHFDLYTMKDVKGGGSEMDKFAPYSHDAELRLVLVPEPESIIIFISTLLIIVAFRIRFHRPIVNVAVS